VWSLSSCKQGFGVQQLREDETTTYWQSDGPQPHFINIQFRKKTRIGELSIYADYKQDESYTPSKLSIRVGTNFHDLREIDEVELNEPNGWVKIPLAAADGSAPLRTHLVQIVVLANHQNGRDTHLRIAKIFAPTSSTTSLIAPFTTDECAAYGSVR